MTMTYLGFEKSAGSRQVGKLARAEGSSTVATGENSHAEGWRTSATAANAHAGGVYATADAWGAWSRSGSNVNYLGANRLQTSIYTYSAWTSNTGPQVMTLDGVETVNMTLPNVLILPQYCAYSFQFFLVSRRYPSSANTSQAQAYLGAVVRDNGLARLLGTPTALGSTFQEVNNGSATFSVGSNTSGQYLNVAANPTVVNGIFWAGTMIVTELVSPG